MERKANIHKYEYIQTQIKQPTMSFIQAWPILLSVQSMG